jgi:proline iminopeptidase
MRPKFGSFKYRSLTMILLLGLATVNFLSSKSFATEVSENGKVFQGTGANIYYEVIGSGSGTPLILANGGPGFDHMYFHVTNAWNEIARTRPVVFYDQRGNGRSGALKEGQTCNLADQVQDLDELVDHLGYEKIDLLGGSWGGYLAMAFAIKHPEKMERLILVDSAAPKFSDTAFRFNDIFPDKIAEEDNNTKTLSAKEASDKNMRIYFSMIFYSEEKRDGFIAKSPTFAIDNKVGRMIINDIRDRDLNPDIAKFKFPVLVITGRFDINVAPTTAYKIHQTIPGSQFVVFEKSGHLPFYEESDKFVRVMNQFMTGK